MAEANKENANASSTAPSENKENANAKGKESTTKKVRNNKPLFSVLVLIGLILLSAIGVGAYFGIRSLTDDDDNDSETEQSEDSSDSNNDESNDENLSSEEDSIDVIAEDDIEEDISSDEKESSNDEDTSSDNEDSESEGSIQEGLSTEKEDLDEDSNSNEESDENDSEDNSEENSSEDSDTEELDENNEANEGAVAGITDTLPSTGHSNAGYQKSLANQQFINSTGIWVATDYVSGDITSSTYTVQLGDTLWEISEGYYGNGFAWTQIRDKNPNVIDFLFTTGEEALITPGSVLNL